jgi:hypothetical protein
MKGRVDSRQDFAACQLHGEKPGSEQGFDAYFGRVNMNEGVPHICGFETD